jgi:hypothetical protein
VPWTARFVDPIILPYGRALLTLRDAAEYITALPKAEHDAADWQIAMEVLLLVAERDGPTGLHRPNIDLHQFPAASSGWNDFASGKGCKPYDGSGSGRPQPGPFLTLGSRRF